MMILIKKDNALYIDDVKICDTLDPGVLTKGLYNLEINHSPKFNRDLPLVYNENFPASHGLRLHAGNSLKDSKGCILVGQKSGSNLINSVNTLNVLIEIIKNNNIKELIII